MRDELAKIHEIRATFTGKFARFGTKISYGYQKKTLLLTDVKDVAGKPATDHLWFNLTAGFEALDLKPGDVVRFDARVRRYLKGYRGRRDDVFDKPVSVDYKLSHPTRLVKLRDGVDMPRPLLEGTVEEIS